MSKSKTMVHPRFSVLPGGEHLTLDVEDDQERRAWGHIARGIELALEELHPLHSRRNEQLEFFADARRAAGPYYSSRTGPVV